MENDKLFEFMEKIYSELQATKLEMQQGFKEVKKEVNKNSIKIEDLEKKVDIIAEVQQNHINQNENNHTEIVEMLSDRIDLTQQAIKKLSKVK